MTLWALEYPLLTTLIVLYAITVLGVVGEAFAKALSIKYSAKQNDKLKQ